MFHVRLENVATPLTSVVTTLVDPVVSVPVDVSVTDTPESATALPLASSTWKVGAGAMTVPAAAVVGTWAKPSFLAAPTVTVMEPLVAVRRPATGSVYDAASVYDPTVVSDAAEKVTTPPEKVRVVVPARAPPEGPLATDSVTEPVLSVLSLLP